MGQNQHESISATPATTSVVTSTPFNPAVEPFIPSPRPNMPQPDMPQPLPASSCPNQNSLVVSDVSTAMPQVPISAQLPHSITSSPQSADGPGKVEQNNMYNNTLPNLNQTNVDATNLLKRVFPSFLVKRKIIKDGKLPFTHVWISQKPLQSITYCI